MNNACFGKTMKNIRKRANIETSTSNEQRQKIGINSTLHLKSYSDTFSLARMTKSKMKL